MKKILFKINRETGELTLTTIGFNGAECLEATRQIREDLGITAEPDKTPEYWQESQDIQQDQTLS